MNILTKEHIDIIKKELDVIVNDNKNSFEHCDKNDIYQFIDDETNYLLLGFLQEYDDIYEQDLCNDFYDVRRDAQEELCAKNGVEL